MKFKLSMICGVAFVLFSYAAASSIDVEKNKKTDELQDLNSDILLKPSDAAAEGIKDINAALYFKHLDEKTSTPPVNLEKDGENFKYDVEILESADLKKDIVENEEQFRGSALHLNTDLFSNENIETLRDPEKVPLFTLACMLTLFVLIALAIYVGLIAWRRRLEQRYGARVLLAQRCDDEDFVYRSNHTEIIQQVPKMPLNPV